MVAIWAIIMVIILDGNSETGAHMQSEIGNLIFLRLFSPYIILKVLIVCILFGPTDVLKLAYAQTLLNRAADLTPFIS